jgi:hypothetical protein
MHESCAIATRDVRPFAATGESPVEGVHPRTANITGPAGPARQRRPSEVLLDRAAPLHNRSPGEFPAVAGFSAPGVLERDKRMVHRALRAIRKIGVRQ